MLNSYSRVKVFHTKEEYERYLYNYTNSDSSGISEKLHISKTENGTYDIKLIRFGNGNEIICLVPAILGTKYKLFKNDEDYWAFLAKNDHESESNIAFSCEDKKYSIHKVIMSTGNEYVCFIENEELIKETIEESRLDAEDYHNMCKELDL